MAGEVDGASVPVHRDPELGLLTLSLPAGPHTVWLKFGDTLAQKAGWALSGLTVLGIVALGLRRRAWVG